MVWAATEGPAIRLRDGREKSDPMKVIGLRPVPFDKLDESELKRLGGSAIVVLKTPQEARDFEAAAKRRHGSTDTAEARAQMVRVKTGAHNAKIIAERRKLPAAPIAELVREAMTKDPEVTWQQATQAAIELLAEQAAEVKAARREEKAARLPQPPPAAPKKGGRRAPARAEDDVEDDEEDGSAEA